MKKKDVKMLSQGLMVGALGAVILSGIGATGTDLWLASTQWLLVAIVLAGFGVYTRLES